MWEVYFLSTANVLTRCPSGVFRVPSIAYETGNVICPSLRQRCLTLWSLLALVISRGLVSWFYSKLSVEEVLSLLNSNPTCSTWKVMPKQMTVCQQRRLNNIDLPYQTGSDQTIITICGHSLKIDFIYWSAVAFLDVSISLIRQLSKSQLETECSSITRLATQPVVFQYSPPSNWWS